MTDIPDDFIGRRSEHSQERQGQLDNPEIGRQMPARLTDGVNHQGTYFARKLGEFIR